MADALNECPRRDDKCPIYVMGNDDQNPTGFLMCDDCGAIGDDPTYRPKKALSADGNVSAGREPSLRVLLDASSWNGFASVSSPSRRDGSARARSAPSSTSPYWG